MLPRYGVVVIALIVFSSCSDLLPLEVQERSDVVSSKDTTIPYTTIVSTPISLDFIYNDGLVHDVPSCKGVENTIKKGFQMAFLKWTPLKTVPCIYSSYGYVPGKEMTGIPYSSVKHINTFVGLDISFYTFLTALHNPYSYIYTEDVRKDPYCGTFCAPYFGTVCSTTVMAALGSEIPFFTNFVPANSAFIKCDTQSMDSIELCDILWSGGHIVMVIDIGRDVNGAIKSVAILETNTDVVKDTAIVKYTVDEFVQRWEKCNWVRYRYRDVEHNLSYIPSDFVVLPEESPKTVAFNNCLSTKKGDKSPYRVGETVYIDVLDPFFVSLELFRNDEYYESIPTQPCLALSDLPYGSYRAFLRKGDDVSGDIFFEVLDTSVNVEQGTHLKVSFSSHNSTPVYICICEGIENVPLCFDLISESDKLIGYKYVDMPTKATRELYCKVLFKGEYGRVANELIPLR